ncbi:MAG: cell wall hydrolase [Agathobacter sp.]|nr:cell wall hydrolase [Agathobacter sp.]
MKLNKKMIEGAVVLGLGLVLTITAVTSSVPTDVKKASENAEANTGLEKDGNAGIATVLSQYAVEDTEETISVEQDEVVQVAAAEPELTAEELEWQSYVLADVDEKMNIRAEASEESDIVGRFRKGDRGTILEAGDEWTKITSGNVTGYVKNEFCVFGTEALAYAKENFDTTAKALTQGLRIRLEASTDGDVAKSLNLDETILVDTTAEAPEGWVAVVYNDATCYVSAEFVEVGMNFTSAITLDEEYEAVLAAQEAAAKEAAAAAQKQGTETTYNTSLAASADELTLLAALIQCEAGGQVYDAQLAVGCVVMNRIRSGAYPNTVYDVIYQRGQFGPAATGKIETRIANGISATAYQAAAEALAGVDNTGGAIGFKLASSGQAGVVYGPIVFF